MGKPFIITPQAQRDFDKTYWWYEEQYQGLGKEFALCVDAKIEEIQRFPEQFQRSRITTSGGDLWMRICRLNDIVFYKF